MAQAGRCHRIILAVLKHPATRRNGPRGRGGIERWCDDIGKARGTRRIAIKIKRVAIINSGSEFRDAVGGYEAAATGRAFADRCHDFCGEVAV